MQPVSDPEKAAVSLADACITVFVCANCARPGRSPAAGVRLPPAAPEFNWPCATRDVLVPCTGRLQPEHILKAFEKGSDAVVVVACEEANCHYLEGSRRILRRIEFLRGLLDDMGLGGKRLMLFHLPGSANEDMILGAAAPPPASLSDEELTRRIRAVRDDVVAQLQQLPPSGLKTAEGNADALAATYEEEEVDASDDSEE
jgi:F420-non-reducing hydrogenase iron-sulfur subunit